MGPGARTSDIPHFFQDDIPCAFGGRPTSGTRTACHAAAPFHKAKERRPHAPVLPALNAEPAHVRLQPVSCSWVVTLSLICEGLR